MADHPSKEGIAQGVLMTRNIIPYNGKLVAYARQLRNNMTLAEVLLWQKLRCRKMFGYDFDRQRPIDKYIVDFYCKDLRLAIEIDGRSHDFKQDHDEFRQKKLEQLGVRFLRFWDSEVRNDMGRVLLEIEEWITVTRPCASRFPLQGGDVIGISVR